MMNVDLVASHCLCAAPTTVQASARLPSGNQNQENLENSDKIKTIAGTQAPYC